MLGYINECQANIHITGSYKDAAKHTGYLDYSDAKPLEYSVTGTFGAYLNSGKITFDVSEFGQ